MAAPKNGYTLAELLVVVVVVGILASLATPSLSRFIARLRTREALNEFTIQYLNARMTAVRSGARVEIAFLQGGGCTRTPRGRVAAHGYRITTVGAGLRTAREVRLEGGVCLASTGDARILLNSRGLPIPFENRTVWARKGSTSDSLTISVLGRVLRRS